MIVVTTPTGQIGSHVVRLLLDRGSRIRVVARDADRLDPEIRCQVAIVEGSHDDPAVLDDALRGADALFWLVPPNPAADSTHQHYLDFARAGSAAVARHGVGHVVGVTSAGHGWSGAAGVLSAAFAMDAELAGSGAAYRALSLPFYLENLLGQRDAIRRGSFALTAADDEPLATVAVRDIAAAATDLLTDLSWTGYADVPLFGPDRATPDEMAAMMSDELGHPVAYRQISFDDFAAVLRQRGASDQLVHDMTEMLAAQDGGIYDDDWAHATIGATDFRTWCREELKPALD